MTKIIGITGGIASGKSAVTAFLRKQGYAVIDADSVVHELQAKGGQLYQALVDYFGPSILDDKGQLDRPVLSQKIFATPETLAKSSQLQDAIIRRELARQKELLREQHQLFFMDIPLLIELDYCDWFDEIWLVYVDDKTQMARLMARNAYSQEEAQKRIASQMSLEDKKDYADVILDNRGSLSELEEQVRQALKALQDES